MSSFGECISVPLDWTLVEVVLCFVLFAYSCITLALYLVIYPSLLSAVPCVAVYSRLV